MDREPPCKTLLRLLAVSLLAIACGPSAWAASPTLGLDIYRQKCASCHGANGEGTKESFPRPLVGERSLDALTTYIAESMPEDKPGTCTGDDAKAVAAFVFETFYSKTARVRFAAPRIELSRLTLRQYQNVVTDLIGSFGPAAQGNDQPGLRGEYYRSRHFGGKANVDRVDRRIDFDFGEHSPVADKLDAGEYAIRWSGSLLPPESGEYDFLLTTSNGARLWINDTKHALIDAGVRSGEKSEYRQSLRLLGGRRVAIRLEITKYKDKVGAVRLQWRPPRRAMEVVPTQCLSAGYTPEVFVLQTPFPPDDRSMGYERGSSVSKAWQQAVTEAALEVATYVAEHASLLIGAENAPDYRNRAKTFCRQFVERAIRRPLTDAVAQSYVERFFQNDADVSGAVKQVVLRVLQSPYFLYREVGGGDDWLELPARLSLAVWDSIPDQALRDAAAAGKLKTRDDVVRQAQRMLGDRRARAKLREFFLQWLAMETPPDLSKDSVAYPGFDAGLASDLRTSLDMFLDDVVWSETSDFRQLLVGDFSYLNARLAKFYGADVPGDGDFHRVRFQPQERAGLLSHPYLMSAYAYTSSSSPIHRGVFLARGVLGRTLRPPPIAVAPLAPDLQPDLTTRQRVALQTQPTACQSCHAMINPLGYSLESFDAAGRLRKEEKGHAIDASGYYLSPSGQRVTFAGARQLAEFLAASDEVHEAFVQQLFHYLIKQPVRGYGPDTLSRLKQQFAQQQFNIRKLVVEIVATAAFPHEVANTNAR